jgi:hypothetical protein
MPTSSRLADSATTLLALHQPVILPTVWERLAGVDRPP